MKQGADPELPEALRSAGLHEIPFYFDAAGIPDKPALLLLLQRVSGKGRAGLSRSVARSAT